MNQLDLFPEVWSLSFTIHHWSVAAYDAIDAAVEHAHRVLGQLGREDFLRRDQTNLWEKNRAEIEAQIWQRMKAEGWA